MTPGFQNLSQNSALEVDLTLEGMLSGLVYITFPGNPLNVDGRMPNHQLWHDLVTCKNGGRGWINHPVPASIDVVYLFIRWSQPTPVIWGIGHMDQIAEATHIANTPIYDLVITNLQNSSAKREA